MRRVAVTADDYGLTRAVTDTVLEAVDCGALTRVSILANGFVFDYAVAEYMKRQDRLEIGVHVNLTEGRPLTRAPLLTDANGFFRYTPQGLLAVYFFSFPAARAAIYAAIQAEVEAQVEKVQTALGGHAIAVDGHQHIHVIPFVLDVLLDMHARSRFAHIRIPYEHFALVFGRIGAYFGKGMFRFLALNALSHRAKERVRAVGIPHNDSFIGTLFSGRLSVDVVAEALALSRGVVEIGTHPGSADRQELSGWSGDVAWHYSPWRQYERNMLASADFRETLAAYVAGGLSPRTDVRRVVKFVLSGTGAALVHISILYMLTEYFGLWYIASATVGWIIAFFVSFALQRFWTFGDRPSRAGHVLQYGLLQAGNIVLNALGVAILTEYLSLWYIASQVVVIGLVAAWTYAASSRIIFAHAAAR